MSLTEYNAKKALEETRSAPKSPRRRGRVSPDTLQQANEIIKEVYLANQHVKYGLWKLCEEALANKNIKISQRRIEDTLTDVKRAHGNVRGYLRVPQEQEAVLERLFGMKVTGIGEIHRTLEAEFGRRSISQASVANWVYTKRRHAKRRARESAAGTIHS